MAEPVRCYHTIRYGNDHGEITFGHIHDDEIISGCQIRTANDGGRHYITMDSSGLSETGRKGGTIMSSPGSTQIVCGMDVVKEIPAFITIAKNGDIVFKAKKGRIRFIAENIDLIASGSDGKNGRILLKGNEKVSIKTQMFDVDANASCKIVSENTVDLIGKSILNVYGGLIDFADGATSIKGSKAGAGLFPFSNELKNLPIIGDFL